jgi:threonine aldolase
VVVLFDPGQAELVRRRRKRAGHLQSKGRFIAAQVLALLEGDLWLANARAANAAAQAIAAKVGERLVHPVEANELFVRLTQAERDALRGQGFAFYDWDDTCCRMVAAWNTRIEDAERLGEAISWL